MEANMQDENLSQPQEGTQAVPPKVELTEHQKQELLDNQNLGMGFLAGLIAAVIGAGIWAGITILTKYQIGWMAVGVGFLVGFFVLKAGKGVTVKFGLLGALLSLFGCLLGNFFSLCGFISIQQSVSFFDVLKIFDFPLIFEAMKETFQPMDALFYGIAIYEGFRISFKNIQ